MKQEKLYNYKFLSLVLFSITIIRIIAIKINGFNLSFDEAQYWHWSNFLSFGYFSKPPVIAWVIRFFTEIFGQSEVAIRAGSSVAHMTTAFGLYLSGKELFSKKTGFFSAIIFITLPGVSFSSLLISTDPFLMCFWSLSLFSFIKAIKTDKLKYWAFLGVFLGLGMLSKYAMIAFLLSMLVFYIWAKNDINQKQSKSKIFLCFLISFLIYLPNYFWNASNDFVSYVHTKANANLEQESFFHPLKALEFLSSQLGVFGLFFIVLLVLLFKIKKQTTNQKDKQAKLSYKLLYSFSYPLIIIMTIEGFLSRANANWAAASYVGASLLVCFYLINNNKVSLVKKIVGFHVLLAVILYLYFPVTKAFNIEHTEKSDFAKRLRGWDEISKEIQNYSKKHPNAILLFDERKTITPPLYYIKPHPFKKIAKFNPSKIIQDHYDLTVDLEENFSNHEEFLLFTRYPNSKHIDKFFNKTTPLGKIKKQIRKNFYITLNAFLLEGFKGY